MTAPQASTVRRMARPRGEIPDAERSRLEAARVEFVKASADAMTAEAELRAACDAAYVAGGSHTVIAEVAGLAKSTVQKYVTSRREAGK